MAGGIPLGQWSGSEATEKLRDSIEAFNRETHQQTRTLIRLTWVIAVLTVMMTCIGAGQIWLALR